MDAAEKEISVITPRSEVFAFRQSASGKVAAFRGDNENRCAALLSLDGAELGKSRKMLLLHLVDVAGSRQKFADSQCFQLESWGTLPLLLKRSKMEVTLKLPGVKVEALRMDGTVSGVVKTEYRDGVLRFQTDTAGVTGGVMAYLLTK